jgi:hypothetical protein
LRRWRFPPAIRLFVSRESVFWDDKRAVYLTADEQGQPNGGARKKELPKKTGD